MDTLPVLDLRDFNAPAARPAFLGALMYLERMAPEHYQSELPLGARAPPRQASLI